MKILITVVATLLLAGTAGAVVVHSGGLLNFAADEPHPSVVEGFIAQARERFIANRSEDVQVPDLGNPDLVAAGAAHYVPMCAGCHLGPGTEDTEIRRGLYPQPPNLGQPEQHAGGHHHGDMTGSARRQFWIIKHGIKMTAMPAWGTTHSDEEIWGLVAFLQKLPEMSPEEYAKLQEPAAGGHEHGDAPADHVDPPGSKPHEHKH
jgi:mono/diheme cytochrome c family protein